MKAIPSAYMPLDSDADHEHLADWPVHFASESIGAHHDEAKNRPTSESLAIQVLAWCVAGPLTVALVMVLGIQIYSWLWPSSCAF